MAISVFGTSRAGQDVHAITLSGHGLQACVLTFGAALQSLRLIGVSYDLTLGSDDLASYEGPLGYHGTIVGPVANRLAGAKALIGGQVVQLHGNEASGHLLHGGKMGTQACVWQIIKANETAVTLALKLQGDGFPGKREIRVTYAIAAPGTLQMEITGTTDGPTLLNLAQHGYWNLDGTDTWAGHQLQIAADSYLPTDNTYIPTGQVRPVKDTSLDFSKPRQLNLNDPFIDNNFCLGHAPAPLRDVVWLTGQSGLRLTFATTETGVQVFNGPEGTRPGVGPYGGIAIEAQGWPDAPNQPTFPSIALAPGQIYHQLTQWRFDRV
jgi:aldose 1-epimerase